jgi:DNA-binding response OmpR family regulator
VTRLEFELHRLLCENRRLTPSRQTPLDHIWGESWFGDPDVADVHISNLREQLGDGGAENAADT